MDDSRIEPMTALARPVYLVAFLLIVTPLADFAANVWPFRFSEIGWRYGTFGLLSGFLLTPLLGVVLASFAANLLGHRWVGRAIGIVDVMVAVALMGGIVLFALDAVQLRAGVPDADRRLFDVSVLKALAKHLSAIVALLWLGWVGIRRPRHAGRHAARKDTPAAATDAERARVIV